MKLLRLTLSDSAYAKALEFAGAHGVPIEAYLSSEVEDMLDELSQLSIRQALDQVSSSSTKPGPLPSFRSLTPATLGQVLDVCTYVYRNGKVPQEEAVARVEFRAALDDVAQRWNVGLTSVRDKCTTTRRLGLSDVTVSTDVFIQWLCRPQLLRDHLCRKFPKCTSEIHKRFAGWLPHDASSRQN
jgi:hypothetical protein